MFYYPLEFKYMKVLIALGNRILSETVKDRLINNGCRHLIDAAYLPEEVAADKVNKYDIIVMNYFSLKNLPDAPPPESPKILVLDTGLSRDATLTLFSTGNIHGLIDIDADISVLIKALAAVGRGEVWINNSVVKSLLDKNVIRKIKRSVKVTDRESAILDLVRNGYRNRDIAGMLSISEQTVKSHLNRIFRKMNVNGRTELVSKLSSML